jgi:hypothetical protein
MSGTVPGSFYEQTFTVTGDTSYTTGGYLLGLPQFQASAPVNFIASIDVVNPWLNAAGTLAIGAVYNSATGKIQAFGGTPASGSIPESAAATNLSTFSCTVRVRYH